MFNHGSYNPQPGQGPQTPRPPPYLQHLPAPPPLRGPFLPPSQVPPRPGQPGLHIYQHGPLGTRLAGQPYLHPPATIQGSAPLPRMYTTAQQNPQHSSYLAPGPPPPSGSHNLEMLQGPLPPRNILPTPSSGYNAPTHQLPQQPPGVQGLRQIPAPPPHPPSSSFSTSALSASISEATVGNSQLPSMAPPPPPPPPPAAYSSPPPIPPSSPPPVSSPVLKSVPLPSGSNLPCHSDPHSNTLCGYKSGDPGPVTEVKPLNRGEHSIPVPNFPVDHGSCFLPGGSGSKVDYLGGDGLPSKTRDVLHPLPKPAEEKIVQKIEEFCQHIAKNGPSYEDMARLKESGNPEFKFLFGGKPGSGEAIVHEYFLWMKNQCLLTNKLDGSEHAVPAKHLMVANEPHSPVDSDMDMEMEDDITMSDNDQAVNQPIEGPTQATDSLSSEFDTNKQLYILSSSAGSEAATTVLSDKLLLSGSSGPGERESKLISSPDELTFGNSVSRAQKVINSAGDTEFPFSGDTVTSSTPLGNDRSSSDAAAAAAECINADKYSGQVMKGGSPFRLLQDYDSNDSSEIGEDPCPRDTNHETVSPLPAVGTENLHRDAGLNLKMDTDTGSKSPYETERGFGRLSESGMSYRAPEFSSDLQREVKEAIPTSISSGLTSELIDAKHEKQSSIDHTASPKALPKEDALEGARAKVAFSGKYEKENENESTKFTSNVQKIDKFGRLVKKGVSDSDTDDSHHSRRGDKRGRSRSRSRSRSPVDRRRRRRGRRSPRRRRGRRSRSRSWSPRNRRSRSRSPSYRHAGEFSSGNTRREKVQMPECFDFLRGRCYRGASCRYMHHDSEKSDASRHHRSKQQYEQLHPSSKNFNTIEDNKKLSLKVSDHEQEVVNGEKKHNYDMSAGSSRAAKDHTFVNNREDSVCDALVDSEIIKSDRSREVAAKLPETKIVKERSEDVKAFIDESDWPTVVDSFPSKPATDANFLKSHGEASQNVLPSLKDSVIQQSLSVLPDPVLEDDDHAAQQTDNSSISDSSPDKTTRSSPEKLHAGKTLPNSTDSLHNLSWMPPFPLSAPNAEGNTAPHMSQLSRDYNLMPKTAEYQSQSAALESFPSYMLPNQISLFSVPLNSSSASLPLLPPPGPTVNAGTAQPGVTLQFQQSCLPLRSDFGSRMFSRPFSTASSGNSQVGEFKHQGYPPSLEPHQPVSHVEDFRLKPPSGCNPSSRQFGGTSLVGEDCLKQLPVHALSASESSTRSNNYPQPVSFSQEVPATKIQSFSGDNLHPGENAKSSSQIHPYLQQPRAPYGFHHSVPDSIYGLPGKISSSSGYPPDLQDKNQSSNLPDFGVSRNSTHFNPYASTFEKPLSSRFSSDVFRQEKDTTYASKHDHPLSLGDASVDGQGVGSTARGDQYDPLFDSIEPSSNSHRKSDHIQKWEPSGDTDIMLKLKGSNQPLDVEENNKKKEIGGIALAKSLDNEEFGETADEEVGDIENGSQSNLNDIANMNLGEMEIDQIKSPGKSKKSKESRSMKLFKACLADFVKEVLKPSWRQGNMSKETFKTVVKKTVDKVSGAMKGHQIPKSKAKINQYIDSSQRKLTKLVMGYVDKYAKG